MQTIAAGAHRGRGWRQRFRAVALGERGRRGERLAFQPGRYYRSLTGGQEYAGRGFCDDGEEKGDGLSAMRCRLDQSQHALVGLAPLLKDVHQQKFYHGVALVSELGRDGHLESFDGKQMMNMTVASAPSPSLAQALFASHGRFGTQENKCRNSQSAKASNTANKCTLNAVVHTTTASRWSFNFLVTTTHESKSLDTHCSLSSTHHFHHHPLSSLRGFEKVLSQHRRPC